MARCFVTRVLPGDAIARLEDEHEVDLWPGGMPPSSEELREHARKATGLLALPTDAIDAELLRACPDLAAIAHYAVGYDNVDVDAATARGIAVSNTPGVLTEATADLAFGLLLAAARLIPAADAFVHRGAWRNKWMPEGFLGRDVHGATLGVIGFGRIGRAVAQRAEGFSMKVLHSGSSSGTPLAELLSRSDFVTIHCPLTAATRHLIDRDALARIKPTAVLVNTSRGPIVDTEALVEALAGGRIGAAALDVTDPEPPPTGHPLLEAPNLVLAPHIGSATHRAREGMADLAVDNLLAALSGDRMPNCVNPEVYEGAGG